MRDWDYGEAASRAAYRIALVCGGSDVRPERGSRHDAPPCLPLVDTGTAESHSPDSLRASPQTCPAQIYTGDVRWCVETARSSRLTSHGTRRGHEPTSARAVPPGPVL